MFADNGNASRLTGLTKMITNPSVYTMNVGNNATMSSTSVMLYGVTNINPTFYCTTFTPINSSSSDGIYNNGYNVPILNYLDNLSG